MVEIEDDQGRHHRESRRDNHRRGRDAQRMRTARALAREAREERERAEAALENREEYTKTLHTVFKDQQVADLSEIPRLGAVITLAVIMGERSVLSDTCALTAANALIRDIREIIDPGHVWSNETGNSFQNYHDNRFSPASSRYIYQHVTLNADTNVAFIIRLMKKAAFQVNDHALVFKYFELIDRDLRENISDEVLKYRFNQVLPKMMIRAVFSQYYCSDCVTLLIDKKELKKHMLQMHRPDVLTQHRRANAELSEEEMYIRLLRRSKLRRHLYGSAKIEDNFRRMREADELTMTMTNNETGERSTIHVHQSTPEPEL